MLTSIRANHGSCRCSLVRWNHQRPARRVVTTRSRLEDDITTQRRAKLTVLEKERDAAVELAQVCSKRSKRLLARIQSLKTYAQECISTGREEEARGSLKTKLQVQETLEATIQRAQNNYTLASRLSDMIGILQQELSVMESLDGAMMVQQPMQAGSRHRAWSGLRRSSSGVEPAQQQRQQEEDQGQQSGQGMELGAGGYPAGSRGLEEPRQPMQLAGGIATGMADGGSMPAHSEGPVQQSTQPEAREGGAAHAPPAPSTFSSSGGSAGQAPTQDTSSTRRLSRSGSGVESQPSPSAWTSASMRSMDLDDDMDGAGEDAELVAMVDAALAAALGGRSDQEGSEASAGETSGADMGSGTDAAAASGGSGSEGEAVEGPKRGADGTSSSISSQGTVSISTRGMSQQEELDWAAVHAAISSASRAAAMDAAATDGSSQVDGLKGPSLDSALELLQQHLNQLRSRGFS